MGYRIYGESEPQESPVRDFLIGLYLGSFGLYGGGAWVLVTLGWIKPGILLLVCTGVGLILGGKLAYDSACRKKTTSKKECKNERERLR